MRILFLTHYFPPEVNAPASRTVEHCREWVRQGHDVHVVTGFPSHPGGVVYPGYRMRASQTEIIDGITVHRVPTVLAPNRGTIRRVLNYLSFVPTALWRGLRLGRFDVVVATSPQFFCAVAGWLTASAKRTPWIFELRDLWPESIAAVGAVKASAALRLLEALELRMYRSASRVVCVTRAFMDNLASRGVPREKLVYVPNGIDPDVWTADAERASARAALDVPEDMLLASYIGTVGMAHGVGTLLDAARRMESRAVPIRFVVVGDGAERAALEQQVAAEGPANVRFLGQVDRAQVPGLMAATDVSLVLLRNTPLFRTVLPSKMFEAMAAGNPIVLGVEGEALRVLDEADAGVGIEPENAGQLADALERFAHAPEERERLGRNGRLFVAKAFNRRIWAGRMLESIRNVARGERHANPTGTDQP